MLKKVPALLFVYAAICIMLVNQSITHHHHESEACFKSHTTCPADCKHNHDNTTRPGKADNCPLCDLFDTLVLPSEQAQKSFLPSTIVIPSDFDGYFAIIPDNCDVNINCFSLIFNLDDSLCPDICSYFRTGTLRAPPLSA